MKSHNSAEELFKHYELFHDTGDLPAHVAPTRWDITDVVIITKSLITQCTWQDFTLCIFVNELFPPSREDLTMLRQEVQDLHASLKV